MYVERTPRKVLDTFSLCDERESNERAATPMPDVLPLRVQPLVWKTMRWLHFGLCRSQSGICQTLPPTGTDFGAWRSALFGHKTDTMANDISIIAAQSCQ